MNDEQIFDLAQAAGLARDWTNANGQPMQVAPAALRAILEALGLPCTSDASCRESRQRLAAMNETNGTSGLPPLVTGTVGQAILLPGLHHAAGKRYRLELESGESIDGRFADADVQKGGVALPPIDRYGYHRLIVEDSQTTLAVAPLRCFGVADAVQLSGDQVANNVQGTQQIKNDPQLWALGVQLYSLRRAGDGGIGDFTSLASLVKSAAAQGAAALAISPVHAMFSADVTRFSPYGPSSRLFLNALHIDPASAFGEERFRAALDSLGQEAVDRYAAMDQADLIDWPAAASLRLSVLRRLYDRFGADDSQLNGFASFCQQQGSALQDHARFEALHAWRLAHGENGDWRSWPEALRDPRGIEVERFAHEHAVEVRFHAFLQWQAARGMVDAQQAARQAGMPVGLIADLAVGADNGGSQAWSRQAEIINGLSVGAPPDALNTRGQSWGLGAFSPHAMKAQGFGAYIEMLRATFAYAGGARIDHVLGLSRLWLVPHGASSEDGAYLTYPIQDLLRLIALESWRHRAIVIGEDLGTVPAGFDQTLAQAGLLGIRVLLFQQQHGRFLVPAHWSRDAVATTTTHDLPTIAGWWQGRDIDWRTRLDLLELGQSEHDARGNRDRERAALWQALIDAGQASGPMPPADAASAPLDAVIGFMAETPAPLAVLPVEDALGLTEAPNLPGTIDTHPNWRRRLPQPAASLLEQPAVAKRLAILNRTRAHRGAS